MHRYMYIDPATDPGPLAAAMMQSCNDTDGQWEGRGVHGSVSGECIRYIIMVTLIAMDADNER